MPGYYIHFAACSPEAVENLSFLRGVEAPDILKKHFRVYGLAKARDLYASLRTNDMPEYRYFEERVQQKETPGSNNGMHYGVSSQPNIGFFWNSLTEEERQNPFFRGYVWHLLTDAIIYKRLGVDVKFREFTEQHKGEGNLEELRQIEVNRLHSDWDKTNSAVKNTYPDVVLPPEVVQLGEVQFAEESTFCYVDWDILKRTVDSLRSFRPLNGSMEEIIEKIMNFGML